MNKGNITEASKGIAGYLLPEIERVLRDCMTTCLNCEHFDEPREICNLVSKRPPARVIACGCNAHKERIPF